MPSRRRFLRALGPALLLTVGGAYALASWDWCGARGAGDPEVMASGSAKGPLVAGAARTRIELSLPVTVAGYPPPRPEASRAELPLSARAVVLGGGDVRVGIVSLDLLTLPESLERAVRAAVVDLGLSELWVVATHSHSSLGGYEDGLLSELAGTGRFREEIRAAVVDAATRALREAAGRLVPVSLEVGEGSAGELVAPRDDEPQADARLLLARLRATDGRPVAELLIISAHPTLRPRDAGVLSPDYPGYLSLARETGGGVTLVLQGAGGNATVNLGERPLAQDDRAPAFAAEVAQRLAGVVLAPADATHLAFSRARVPLPRPDASRLAPPLVRAAGDNLLCAAASREAEIAVLAVGPLRLLALPGEVTFSAGQRLEVAAGARVVSLANGYLGYVNTAEAVRAGTGESRRQYFGPGLLDALERAARAAARRP